ncbi:MAG: DUF5615 family PIN-like protein [Aggregatilineales bacterium]
MAEFVRVQDTVLYGKEDTEVLEYAVQNDFFVLTHDVNTMRGYYYERIEAGLTVPGLFLVAESKPVRDVIESLELILRVSDASDWAGGIHFLPL